MRDRMISVVICAYTEDRWDRICAAVESVRRQSLPSAEIIVVCDHNPDLFAKAVASLPADVTVVESRQAPGLSGARNTGVSQATGQIVAFLDDDAAAHEDWLKFLADNYEKPGITGVGGMTLPRWETARPSWLPAEFFWVIGCHYTGMQPAGVAIRNLIGANMSFRRSAFDLVEDGFPVGAGRSAGSRPFGGEETEFCIRLRQKAPDSLLIMDDRAVVWHFVPDRRCSFSYFVSRCFAEGISKARLTKKVGSRSGLSAERSYTTKVLPIGIAAGIAEFGKGDVSGLLRAAAIVVGFSVTAAGYLSARLR